MYAYANTHTISMNACSYMHYTYTIHRLGEQFHGKYRLNMYKVPGSTSRIK